MHSPLFQHLLLLYDSMLFKNFHYFLQLCAHEPYSNSNENLNLPKNHILASNMHFMSIKFINPHFIILIQH
jgi:hypothetical protein